MSGPAFEALSQKRKKIAGELAELETKIYATETDYVANADCTSFGTVLKGFEGFLVSKNAQARNKNRTFRPEDRAFSLSSYTSPATREILERTEQFPVDNAYGGRGKGAYTGGVKGVAGAVPAKRGY